MPRPFVSVIIPTYNEADHIDGVLESMARQTHGVDRLEVLVIDGRSEDDTREKAVAWEDRLDVTVLDNRKRQQGAALNIGLAAASHELVVRLDAHATYADDYVERCVDALETSDAMMVGGPMRPEGLTAFGEGVAVATTTPVGVGPGRFHYSETREYVDTVFLGAYRRSEILELGGYDENLQQAAEDHELAYRITSSGGRILLDPAIRSTYYPRSTPRSLAQQYHNYGLGKASTLGKHGTLPTWRPLAPALFVLGLALGPVLVARRVTRRLFTAGLVGYGTVIVGASVRGASGRPAVAGRSAAAMAIMHIAYGLGFWRGVLGSLGGESSSHSEVDK